MKVVFRNRCRSRPSRHNAGMPREFDPLTLRLFIAVCEEGNIARAAAPTRTRLKPCIVSVQDGARIAQAPASTCVRTCFGNSTS